MNQKRKAELQRKLSMTSVPKPPAGLAERIKADIPHELMNTERDRERLSRSTAFSMRVAASIILLISVAYLSIHLLSRSERETMMPSVARAKLSKQAPQAAAQSAPAAPPPAEVTITLAEEPKAMHDHEAKPAERRAAAEGFTKKEKDDEGRNVFAAGKLAARAPAAIPPPPSRPAATRPVPASAAMDAQAEAPAAQARMEAMNGARSVTAAAPAIVNSAQADMLSFAAPRAIFGISVDPGAFDRIKRTIEQGERPAAGSVDVAALVNYFAGAVRPPRRDVRLDVEASRAPLADSDSALIRFTVDTPSEEVAPGASVPPVATGADLEISLNSDAVASHRLIGAEELKTQATLMKNMSVTGMLDIKLKPRVMPRTTVATLRLRYRSVEDGKPRTITRTVHADDLTRTWASASRRHRLATLGAVWSQSLNEGGPAGDVASTAEKLATEAPEDARARDLAAVASAFSRLRSSGPTGSGD